MPKPVSFLDCPRQHAGVRTEGDTAKDKHEHHTAGRKKMLTQQSVRLKLSERERVQEGATVEMRKEW